MNNKFCICKNINIFGYLGGGGGEGGFNNQTGPILNHIYPPIYINLHIKYGSNLIQTYVQQGKTIENLFFIYGPSKKIFLGYLRGLVGGGGGLQRSAWTDLAFQLSSHPYICTCEIRKQSDNNFLSSNPEYEKKCLRMQAAVDTV